MSFAMEIHSFADKAMGQVERHRRAITLALFGEIITRTPVGTSKKGYTGGRLRGNWQCSIGAPKTGQLDLRPEEVAVSEMQGVVLSASGDVTVWLVNNLPYAYRIEYEGWSKKKAPQGMVRVSMSRFIALGSQAQISGEFRT